MSKPIERPCVTKNQHAIEAHWKIYLEQRRKLHRPIKKEELLTSHRVAFFCGAASGAGVIIRALEISSDPLAQRQWANDILYEIRENLLALEEEFREKKKTA